jgi:hypothetical protein
LVAVLSDMLETGQPLTIGARISFKVLQSDIEFIMSFEPGHDTAKRNNIASAA